MNNQRKKILFGINEFGYGGAEFMLKELLLNLDQTKFDIYVFVKYSKQETSIENELIANNINIRYFNCQKGFSIKFLYQCYTSLKKIRPSIIHTHLAIVLYFIPYILLHKCKCFHTVHSTPDKETSKIKLALKLLNSKVILIGISETIAKMIKSYYKVKYKVPIIYNPVNLEKFLDIPFNRDEKIVTCIIVARLVPVKNHELLLKAFRQVLKSYENIQLYIVGDGPLKQILTQYTYDLNINQKVFFYGQRDDIPHLLKTADIFILCSTYEGLPLSILEAMAAGLPIIATDVGGVGDIVKDNGILVANNNVEELSEAILDLAKNTDKRKQMEVNSLNSVNKYDSSIMTKSHEELYLSDSLSCIFLQPNLKYSQIKKDLISIIVPVYNTEKHLREALDSILAQTYQNWEAIIINDGSKDNSAKICEEYITKDPRFIYINKKDNEGLLLARKTGLENSSGEYIANLDSDDYYLPQFLEKMIDKIHENDFVWCNFNNDNTKYSNSLADDRLTNCLNIATIYKGSLCNKLIRRDIYEKVLFPDKHLINGEDYIQTLSILYHSNRAQFVSDTHYFYRRDNISTSRPSNSDMSIFYARSTFGGIIFYLIACHLLGDKNGKRFFGEIAVFYFQLYFLLSKEEITKQKLGYVKQYVPAFGEGLKFIKVESFKRKIWKLTLHLACKGITLPFQTYYKMQKRRNALK